MTLVGARRFDLEGAATSPRPSPFLRELTPDPGPAARGGGARASQRGHHAPCIDAADDRRAEALRRWRSRRARAAGVAPSALLPDNLLTKVVEAAPADLEALAAIPGTGPLVLAGLADELLAACEDESVKFTLEQAYDADADAVAAAYADPRSTPRSATCPERAGPEVLRARPRRRHRPPRGALEVHGDAVDGGPGRHRPRSTHAGCSAGHDLAADRHLRAWSPTTTPTGSPARATYRFEPLGDDVDTRRVTEGDLRIKAPLVGGRRRGRDRRRGSRSSSGRGRRSSSAFSRLDLGAPRRRAAVHRPDRSIPLRRPTSTTTGGRPPRLAVSATVTTLGAPCMTRPTSMRERRRLRPCTRSASTCSTASSDVERRRRSPAASASTDDRPAP